MGNLCMNHFGRVFQMFIGRAAVATLAPVLLVCASYPVRATNGVAHNDSLLMNSSSKNQGEDAPGVARGDMPSCETPPFLAITQCDGLVVAGLGVACPAGINHFARFYDLKSLFPDANLVRIGCVEFAIEANSGSDAVCTLGVYGDKNGGSPQSPEGQFPDLALLSAVDVVIPADSKLELYSVVFPDGVYVSASKTLVVDLKISDQTGDVFFGCASEPESSPTYLFAPNCGLTVYTKTASIDFPDAHWIQTVWLQSDPECAADLDSSGVVDGKDLGLLLANWGGAGQGDLDGDLDVDHNDVLHMFNSWGNCQP